MSSVKKTTCDRYDVRVNGEWAIICISEAGGVFMTNSSFGDWAYNWPHHGRESFRHFLLGLDRDHGYIHGKLAQRDEEFDFDASVKRMKTLVGKAYAEKRSWEGRNGIRRVFGKELCREVLDEIDGLEDTFSPDDFARQVMERLEVPFFDYEELGDCIVKVPNRQLDGFLKKIWPVFLEAIKAEILEPVAK